MGSFLVFILPVMLNAQELGPSGQEFKFSPAPDFSLKFIAAKADVVFKMVSGQRVFLVKIEEMGAVTSAPKWTVEKSELGSAVTLKILGLEAPSAVRVAVSGPAFPVEVFLSEGKVVADGWASAVSARFVKGEFVSTAGSGMRNVFLKTGKASVRSLNGVVKFDSYRADIEVSDSKGMADIYNFSGPVEIKGHSGKLNIKSYNGKTTIEGAQAELDFAFDQGDFRVTEFEGKINGDGGDANVKLAYAGKADISVKTKAGNVTIVSPKNSGSVINVGSEEGFLNLPGAIKRSETLQMKLGQGRLDGPIQGKVFVRTKSGAISVK